MYTSHRLTHSDTIPANTKNSLSMSYSLRILRLCRNSRIGKLHCQCSIRICSCGILLSLRILHSRPMHPNIGCTLFCWGNCLSGSRGRTFGRNIYCRSHRRLSNSYCHSWTANCLLTMLSLCSESTIICWLGLLRCRDRYCHPGRLPRSTWNLGYRHRRTSPRFHQCGKCWLQPNCFRIDSRFHWSLQSTLPQA